MKYEVAFDLKKFPLSKRNNIIGIVKRSNTYYKLENQILEVNLACAKEILSII